MNGVPVNALRALQPLGDASEWRLLPRLKAAISEELRYRSALRELSRLDDRDLDDLDLGRGDLPSLARRHARGEA